MVLEKPVVVVVAVTGKQGKAVADALLAENKYSVRGTVRRFQPEMTKELEDKGLEVLEMDFDKPDTLGKACQGAYAAFLYTTPVESPESEVKHGVAAATAMREAGVRHIVFSSLPDLTAISGGQFEIPFFTNKAQIEAEIRRLDFPKATFIMPGLFWQNLYEWAPPIVEKDHAIFAVPAPGDAPVPYVDIRDIGPAVAHIIAHPRKFKDVSLPFYSEMITPENIAREIGEVTGKPCQFKQLTPKEAADKGFLPDLVKAFQVIGMKGYFPPEMIDADSTARAQELCQSLSMKTLKDYLADTDWQSRWGMLAKSGSV